MAFQTEFLETPNFSPRYCPERYVSGWPPALLTVHFSATQEHPPSFIVILSRGGEMAKVFAPAKFPAFYRRPHFTGASPGGALACREFAKNL
jgi:hypothetical protein